MKKWKKVLSGALAGVMILECGLTAKPMRVQAQEATEKAEMGTVYEIYKAFRDGTEIATNGAWVDPEFGTEYTVTLNSSISPRAIELQYQQNAADNGRILATFECNRLPKGDKALVAERRGNGNNINENLSSFPIYESIDGGRTWGAGDTDKPARGNNYVPVGYVQNQDSTSGTIGMRNCPQLYEMPETIGNLTKGTILCAGNSIEAGENKAAANAAQSKRTNLDLCISNDLGRTWKYHSTIVGPTEGLCVLFNNTVWEPFFLTYGGKLYCFYSDEAFDDTTDQDIAYVVYDGAANTWSEKRRLIYTKGQRPGMPVVSQLADGRFMLTYEIEGGGGPGSGYILSAANDPEKWYDKDGSLKDTAKGEFVVHNAAKVVNGGGAPYNITTDKKTVLYNNNGGQNGQIWASSSTAPDDADAFWRYYNTGLDTAYNREIMQLANGNIFVIAGWDNSGVKCVTWDYEMDLEKTGCLQNKIPYNGEPVYLAYNNSPLFVWSGKDGHAEENQYYEFQEIENGIYILLSTNNGKAVAAETAEPGSQVNTFRKDRSDARQHWVFEEASDGYYRVKNLANDLYLTSPRTQESDERDLRLTMEEKQESDSQLWKPDITVKMPGDDKKPETPPENPPVTPEPPAEQKIPTPAQIEKNNPGLPKGNSEESRNSGYAKLAARAVKNTKNSNQLRWTKVKSADGYIVLGNKCGKKNKFKTIQIISKNKTVSYTHKKLKKGTYYKYIVQAYKMEKGKLKILATSKTIYAATAGGKYGNVKSLKLNKTSVKLKKGKKFTIKAKEGKTGKKFKSYRKTAFESGNAKIATVSSKGVIKAKKKGTCYIYVYAQNGICKKIKVTVK